MASLPFITCVGAPSTALADIVVGYPIASVAGIQVLIPFCWDSGEEKKNGNLSTGFSQIPEAGLTFSWLLNQSCIDDDKAVLYHCYPKGLSLKLFADYHQVDDNAQISLKSVAGVHIHFWAYWAPAGLILVSFTAVTPWIQRRYTGETPSISEGRIRSYKPFVQNIPSPGTKMWPPLSGNVTYVCHILYLRNRK